MTSNELVGLLWRPCLFLTLAVELIVVIAYLIGHRKSGFNWATFLVVQFGANALAVFIFFIIIIFLPKKTIERKIYDTEVIESPYPTEIVKTIEIESIMLPLEPVGTQAVVINTLSTETSPFIHNIYKDNVAFFNARLDATFLLNENGFENYTGLDLSKIKYTDGNTSVDLDELGFDTVWLFGDMYSVHIRSRKTLVFLYTPYVDQDKAEELKLNNPNLTIIAIGGLK